MHAKPLTIVISEKREIEGGVSEEISLLLHIFLYHFSFFSNKHGFMFICIIK